MSVSSQELHNIVESIYNNLKDKSEGEVADYIPQLACVDPNCFGISIYDLKNKKLMNFGDVGTHFTLQSCSKPFTYALALSLYGHDEVHKWVGYEPSGRDFNELSLDKKGRPANPLINAGAIVTASLIERDEKDPAIRYSVLEDFYQKIAGSDEKVGYHNRVFCSEKHHGAGNKGLYYLMANKGIFPSGATMEKTLDLYFQACSITINCRIGAMMGATLANSGISPLTNEVVLDRKTTRDCLSLMYSCGMYNYSGKFQFDVGLPAKSGVSGGIIAIVPRKYGICVWSPPLDHNGNSWRGVDFYRQLVKKIPSFHRFYDLIAEEVQDEVIENKDQTNQEKPSVGELLSLGESGNLEKIKEYYQKHPDLDFNQADYDGRTLLHITSKYGQIDIVKFLIEIPGINLNSKDDFGYTPRSEATGKLNLLKENPIIDSEDIDKYQKILELLGLPKSPNPNS